MATTEIILEVSVLRFFPIRLSIRLGRALFNKWGVRHYFFQVKRLLGPHGREMDDRLAEIRIAGRWRGYEKRFAFLVEPHRVAAFETSKNDSIKWKLRPTQEIVRPAQQVLVEDLRTGGHPVAEAQQDDLPVGAGFEVAMILSRLPDCPVVDIGRRDFDIDLLGRLIAIDPVYQSVHSLGNDLVMEMLLVIQVCKVISLVYRGDLDPYSEGFSFAAKALVRLIDGDGCIGSVRLVRID